MDVNGVLSRKAILFSVLNISIVIFLFFELSSLENVGGPIFSRQRFVTYSTIPHQFQNSGSMSKEIIHNVEYGSPLNANNRTPVVMIRASLDPSLHSRFLQYSLFSCNESELKSFDGLENRVKIPVYIYEGYFHSLATKERIFSRNPNPTIAVDFMKPPAGSFIRAFYESFRRINSIIFNQLKQELKENAMQRLGPRLFQRDVCYGFGRWIEDGRLFGDLSIQIHYGKGNDDKFKGGQAWHTDADNSLLHLAVTIRGSRYPPRPPSPCPPQSSP